MTILNPSEEFVNNAELQCDTWEITQVSKSINVHFTSQVKAYIQLGILIIFCHLIRSVYWFQVYLTSKGNNIENVHASVYAS